MLKPNLKRKIFRYQHLEFHSIENALERLCDDLIPSSDLSDHSAKVAVFGSCFAQNLKTALREMSIDAHGLEIVEYINTPLANKIYLQAALGKIDLNEEQLSALSTSTDRLDKVRQALTNSRMVIFTLGVGFVWVRKQTNQPVIVPDIQKLHDYSTKYLPVGMQASLLGEIVSLVREVNPTAKIWITLSPVPLEFSLNYNSPVVSDCVSKSLLRSAIHEAQVAGYDFSYFPSFEFFRWLSGHFAQSFFGADGKTRHVNQEFVKLVTRTFLSFNDGSKVSASKVDSIDHLDGSKNQKVGQGQIIDITKPQIILPTMSEIRNLANLDNNKHRIIRAASIRYPVLDIQLPVDLSFDLNVWYSTLKKTNLLSNPWPYALIDNFLPQKIYDSLISNLPNGPKPASSPSRTWISTDGTLFQSRPNKYVVFSEDEKYWWGTEILVLLTELTYVFMKRETFLNLIAPFDFGSEEALFTHTYDEVIVSVRLTHDRDDYDLRVHTDLPEKLLSILVYLPIEVDSTAGGTSLYSPKIQHQARLVNDPRRGVKYFPVKFFERKNKVPFQSNLALVFARRDDTWHGKPQEDSEFRKDRFTLQINYFYKKIRSDLPTFN